MMRICAQNLCAFEADTLVDFHPRKKQQGVTVPTLSGPVVVYPKTRAILQLKKAFKQQKFIILWSHRGDEWADALGRALGLELFIHVAMGKITEVYDLEDSSKWLTVNY